MGTFTLKNGLFLFEGFDMSGLTNTATINYESELKDVTTLDQDSRLRAGALLNSGINLSGFWDSAEGKELFDSIGTSPPEVLTYVPEGGTIGNRAFFFQGNSASYTIGDEVGEIFPFSLASSGNGPLVRGTLMENQSAVVADANGTSRVFAALAASDRMYAAIHVTSFSGTSIQFTIESDDDGIFDSASTTRITPALVTGIGAQFVSVSGPITDTNWRVVWDITAATVDFSVTLGISDK